MVLEVPPANLLPSPQQGHLVGAPAGS